MSKVNAGSILSVANARMYLADMFNHCLPFLFLKSFLFIPFGFHTNILNLLISPSQSIFPEPSDCILFRLRLNVLFDFSLKKTTINISPHCKIFSIFERRYEGDR
jgi:hypothetical protein